MGYFHNLFINGTVGFLLQCIFSHLLLPYPKDVCLCKIMYSIKLIPNLWPTDIFALCRSTPTAVPVQPRRRISSKMSSKPLISAAFFDVWPFFIKRHRHVQDVNAKRFPCTSQLRQNCPTEILCRQMHTDKQECKY